MKRASRRKYNLTQREDNVSSEQKLTA